VADCRIEIAAAKELIFWKFLNDSRNEDCRLVRKSKLVYSQIAKVTLAHA
jgi:hypothetical protein